MDARMRLRRTMADELIEPVPEPGAPAEDRPADRLTAAAAR
jgi:hypothetical protein